MFFHWLRAYNTQTPTATAEAEAIVDVVFECARAASPAVFEADSRVRVLQDAKFEHMCPWAALIMLGLPENRRQRVLETLLDRLEIGLREAGVGDMVVGKKVRTLAAALHGRLLRYSALIGARKWQDLAVALAEHGVEEGVAALIEAHLTEKSPQKRLAEGA